MAAPAINGQRDFVRPPKSSRRNKTPPKGITQSVTDAYNNAPDFGISSTVQNAYQQAPDLGVQSTISRTLGYPSDAQASVERTKQEEQLTQEHTSEEQIDKKKELTPYEISKQRGPSNQDRIGKTQKEIGTEYGIPTKAGAGTTVSPDKTNELALERSHSSRKTKPRQAAVPEDYAPEPCPDKHAGSGKVDGFEHRLTNGKEKKDKRLSNNSTHQHQRNESGNQSPKSATSSERKRRSLGAKLRDQIKGELKILSGSITNNEDKINLGLNIKHGDA